MGTTNRWNSVESGCLAIDFVSILHETDDRRSWAPPQQYKKFRQHHPRGAPDIESASVERRRHDVARIAGDRDRRAMHRIAERRDADFEDTCDFAVRRRE